MSKENNNINLKSFLEIANWINECCTCINAFMRDREKSIIGQEDERNEYVNNVEKEIDRLLEYLETLTIDSYEFTFGANQAAQNLDQEVSKLLMKKIEVYTEDVDDVQKRQVAFIAYYLVAYLFRLYDADKLESFLEEYENFFQKYYALTYQIRGRQLRAKKEWAEAIQNDRMALDMLERQGIENIGVKVTYASTIASILENREGDIEITEMEINTSISNVSQAIQINQKYSRYHYLLAKLILYQTQNEIYNYTYITWGKWLEKKSIWSKKLKKANESIQRALNLLNEKTVSHTGFLVTYHIVAENVKRVQAEIDLFEGVYEQFQVFQKRIYKDLVQQHQKLIQLNNTKIATYLKKNKEEMNEANKMSMESIKNEINENLKESQMRYLEILAVFVAIVGVIVTTNEIFAKEFSFNESIFVIIVLNAGVLAVYACFKIIFSTKIYKRYVIVFLIACVIIGLSLVLGNWLVGI